MIGSTGARFPAEKTLQVTGALAAASVPYAIGGAIALLYWGEPRGTLDIDVNIFVPSRDAERVLELLRSISVDVPAAAAAAIMRTGQARVDFGGTPLDLFFSDVPFHDAAAGRFVHVPFDGGQINILSAEDLVICKAMFNRRKDWADIEQVLFMRGAAFDSRYARGWLVEMLGEADSRVAEFDAISAAAGAER